MKADADLFLAYEYGSAIGRPASEVLLLPRLELLGFVAHRKIVKELMDDAS